MHFSYNETKEHPSLHKEPIELEEGTSFETKLYVSGLHPYRILPVLKYKVFYNLHFEIQK